MHVLYQYVKITIKKLELYPQLNGEQTMTTFNPSDFLTAGQAARRIAVSRGTIHRWGQEGRLKRVRVGCYYRYSIRDLEQQVSLPLEH